MSNETRMKLMEELQWRGNTHVCQGCNSPTYCVMEDGKSGNLCWCMDIKNPPTPTNVSDTCMCRDCLIKEHPNVHNIR
jgi:hypothetical protein